MDSISRAVSSELGRIVIFVAFGFGPMFMIAALLLRQKKKARSLADEPFTKLPLRPPGESLRLKIDQLSDDFDLDASVIAIVGIISAASFWKLPVTIVNVVVIGSIALVAYLYFGRRAFKSAQELWNYRLGFMGERAVGEELNQLLAFGFRVFHDVPFDGFNIDHVVVGPPGVYAVETKTRSKPTDIKGLDRATVTFDGSSLQFPKYTCTEAVIQARRNADTLAKWLHQATGIKTAPNPILALPGWFVIRRARSDVNVLNPDEIKHSFPSRSGALTAEQI